MRAYKQTNTNKPTNKHKQTNPIIGQTNTETVKQTNTQTKTEHRTNNHRNKQATHRHRDTNKPATSEGMTQHANAVQYLSIQYNTIHKAESADRVLRIYR
jgi:hypothetical protein